MKCGTLVADFELREGQQESETNMQCQQRTDSMTIELTIHTYMFCVSSQVMRSYVITAMSMIDSELTGDNFPMRLWR
jgi:hypothetical protein